jgi:cytochrome c553
LGGGGAGARKLSDEQIKGLANYFAKHTPQPIAARNTASLQAGKEIFEHGIPPKETLPCVTCHDGPNAESLASFPRLAWQHQNYLMNQLQVFRDTEGRPGTPMKQATLLVSKQEMDDVTNYLQAFPADK